MTTDIQPGLLVLHGNRSELLAEAVFEWVRRQPLQPLEQEVFLVQSNGVAEWLKMALATQTGICAATRVELPGRFMWRAYRQILGRATVPGQSALDKQPLTWRLMQILPGLLSRPEYEPLAGFLRGDDLGRRLQLAQRLADLYDQYQVYRSDWLAAWAAGDDILPRSTDEAGRVAQPLPPDQQWQGALWREVLAPLTEQQRAATRPQLHRRFLAALGNGAEQATPIAGNPRIARRVVLFGMTHVPMQTLEALAALSRHCQVLLAIPNPCRYHWADIIQGRELLRMERRRHPSRNGRDLSAVSLEDMHAHAHPLLAAWGRQGRDFVRQLDAFDDALLAQQRFAAPRVDLFDDEPGVTLLQKVQANIRDLVPLAEHLPEPIDPADRSIVFHIAHSGHREVEILHDQLLALLARSPADAPLNPRDVVVMVPDIEIFAPAIRSVFGQYPRGDARFIPFDIADLKQRGTNPLLVAVEWLLRLPQQRCRLTEVRDLLDVPGVAQRFGLQSQDLPRLTQWMEGAGIRWGLNSGQRSDQGLEACGDQNTWLFGLRRMLLGYASGDGGPEFGADAAFQSIQPYAEVGGLEASIAGSLADLVDALVRWWTLASTPATPAEWAERGRQLIADFFEATDDRERLTVASLGDALRGWLEACELAAFEVPVSLPVAREAWLSGLDEQALNKRFKAGGVTFCTLMPMRAIPFEAVCLLGMNDGDYPRSTTRSDFDLMGLPGQMRPGDRSRRDDDRQLMLEAVLSARRVLYVSWTGRSVRDNSEQPASVLVSQLRDYLAAGWGDAVLPARTTEHPLQPFSRAYFEVQDEHRLPNRLPSQVLFTHAREWRAAHAQANGSVQLPPLPPFEPDPRVPLTVMSLARFLKNPVRDFFRLRLDVVFRDFIDTAEDDEAFSLDGLEEYGLIDQVINEIIGAVQDNPGTADVAQMVAGNVARIRRSGRLPMAEMGRRTEQGLIDSLVPMFECWREMQALYPDASAKEPLRFPLDAPVLDDWLDGLRTGSGGQRVWLELVPSKLCADLKTRNVRADKLIAAWVRSVVASACGVQVQGVIVGRDATVTIQPMPPEDAHDALAVLMQAWRDGMTAPLPLPCKTALALVRGVSPALVAVVYQGSAYEGGGSRGEVDEACLSRMYPDYESLCADGRFEHLADQLFGPLIAWIKKSVTLDLHSESMAHE